MAQNHKRLLVWQRSKALAVQVYRLTAARPIAADFGLRDQMRRAAVSVCSNIAEGDSRLGAKEATQFFYIAKGSLAELSAQLEVAVDVHSLENKVVQGLLAECDELSAMIQALINHRRS